MKYLAKQRAVIITTPDKGGAVVIMDIGNYVKESNRFMSNKSNYQMVNDTLDRF